MQETPASPLVRTIRIIAVIGAAVALLTIIAHELLLIFLAALIGVLLEGAAAWIAQHLRWRKGWALAACSLGIVYPDSLRIRVPSCGRA